MDSYSFRDDSFDHAGQAEPQQDIVEAGLASERRMHVRAYNYWCSLLDGRDVPSIEDLDPDGIADFGDHSVILDFTSGGPDPATPFIGAAIRRECGLPADGIGRASDVPGRSLLSLLTDHYPLIIANRAPSAFEAVLTGPHARTVCHRGILMPFSSDGETIDFVLGVINWADARDEGAAMTANASDDDDALMLTDALAPDGEVGAAAVSIIPVTPVHLAWEDGPLADTAEPSHPITEGPIPGDDDAIPSLAADASLADRLSAARDCAERCQQADTRSRAALYRALSLAYDLAIEAERDTDAYAAMLERAGLTVQARAPMTPIVKLVFGIDYDKTRLTEFAAALSNAARRGVRIGEFAAFVEAADGGLKGLVAQERKARRPALNATDRAETGRAQLRRAAPIALSHLPTNEEFALVLTRRNADGVHEVVELVGDPSMLDRALRRAGTRPGFSTL